MSHPLTQLPRPPHPICRTPSSLRPFPPCTNPAPSLASWEWTSQWCAPSLSRATTTRGTPRVAMALTRSTSSNAFVFFTRFIRQRESLLIDTCDVHPPLIPIGKHISSFTSHLSRYQEDRGAVYTPPTAAVAEAAEKSEDASVLGRAASAGGAGGAGGTGGAVGGAAEARPARPQRRGGGRSLADMMGD